MSLFEAAKNRAEQRKKKLQAKEDYRFDNLKLIANEIDDLREKILFWHDMIRDIKIKFPKIFPGDPRQGPYIEDIEAEIERLESHLKYAPSNEDEDKSDSSTEDKAMLDKRPNYHLHRKDDIRNKYKALRKSHQEESDLTIRRMVQEWYFDLTGKEINEGTIRYYLDEK